MRKEYDFSKAKRGAIVPPDRKKTRITIRLDTKILNWFRQRVHEAGGGNYQTMINDALKSYIKGYHAENKELLSDSMESTSSGSGFGESGNLVEIPGAMVRIEQFSSIGDAQKKEANVIKGNQPKYNKRGK